MSWPPPVTLNGNLVTIAPLTQAHAADLAEASADGQLVERPAGGAWLVGGTLSTSNEAPLLTAMARWVFPKR